MKQAISGSSWIRRWFLKQDNTTLWAIYICWILTISSAVLALIAVIGKAVL